MNTTHCPTCGRLTPKSKAVCPYCPWQVRRAQYLGACAAYVVAGLPLLAGLIALFNVFAFTRSCR